MDQEAPILYTRDHRPHVIWLELATGPACPGLKDHINWVGLVTLALALMYHPAH